MSASGKYLEIQIPKWRHRRPCQRRRSLPGRGCHQDYRRRRRRCHPQVHLEARLWSLICQLKGRERRGTAGKWSGSGTIRRCSRSETHESTGAAISRNRWRRTPPSTLRSRSISPPARPRASPYTGREGWRPRSRG